MLMDRLLTMDEVAAIVGCSRATIKRRIASGCLPAFRDGRLVRVRPRDLDGFVSTHMDTRRGGGAIKGPASVTLPSGEKLWH
jgi:excisionase family DNA binding protein